MDLLGSLVPQDEAIVFQTRPSVTSKWPRLLFSAAVGMAGLAVERGPSSMTRIWPTGRPLWEFICVLTDPGLRPGSGDWPNQVAFAVWLLRTDLGAILMVVAAALSGCTILCCLASSYMVTVRRVLIAIGPFAHEAEEVAGGRIRAVSLHRSLTGLAFGFGTVKVHGFGGERLVFEDACAPLALLRAIEAIER